MGVIVIDCPRTGVEVSTGKEVETGAFHTLKPIVFRMRCKACGSEHAWSRGNARRKEDDAAEVADSSFDRPRDVLDDILAPKAKAVPRRFEPAGTRIGRLAARLLEMKR